MDSAQHLDALRAETSRFADVLAAADHQRPVPPCPGWTLADLGRHLGEVHRWAAAQVRARQPGEAVPRQTGDGPGADLAGWYAERANELVDLLAGTDPAAPCWTFGPPPVAAFWSRRQAQETMVHRWDAEASQGPPGALDRDRCVDGIDELVEVMVPRQLRLGRREPLAEAVELHAGGRAWVLGDGPPRASLTAPPDRLLLLLWRRLDAGDPSVSVEGESEVVARILRTGLVP